MPLPRRKFKSKMQTADRSEVVQDLRLCLFCGQYQAEGLADLERHAVEKHGVPDARSKLPKRVRAVHDIKAAMQWINGKAEG